MQGRRKVMKSEGVGGIGSNWGGGGQIGSKVGGGGLEIGLKWYFDV